MLVKQVPSLLSHCYGWVLFKSYCFIEYSSVYERCSSSSSCDIDVSICISLKFSEGQRKSYYEENEQEKQQNNDLIDTMKKEIKLRLTELSQAKAVIGEEEAQIKKYLNDVCPVGNKNAEQVRV